MLTLQADDQRASLGLALASLMVLLLAGVPLLRWASK